MADARRIGPWAIRSDDNGVEIAPVAGVVRGAFGYARAAITVGFIVAAIVGVAAPRLATPSAGLATLLIAGPLILIFGLLDLLFGRSVDQRAMRTVRRAVRIEVEAEPQGLRLSPRPARLLVDGATIEARSPPRVVVTQSGSLTSSGRRSPLYWLAIIVDDVGWQLGTVRERADAEQVANLIATALGSPSAESSTGDWMSLRFVKRVAVLVALEIGAIAIAAICQVNIEDNTPASWLFAAIAVSGLDVALRQLLFFAGPPKLRRALAVSGVAGVASVICVGALVRAALSSELPAGLSWSPAASTICLRNVRGDGVLHPIGVSAEGVVAIDANTGARIWRAISPLNPRFSCEDDALLVLGGTEQTTTVSALDPRNGNVQWTKTLPFRYVEARPEAHCLAVIGVQGEGASGQRQSDAFDRKSGEPCLDAAVSASIEDSKARMASTDELMKREHLDISRTPSVSGASPERPPPGPDELSFAAIPGFRRRNEPLPIVAARGKKLTWRVTIDAESIVGDIHATDGVMACIFRSQGHPSAENLVALDAETGRRLYGRTLPRSKTVPVLAASGRHWLIAVDDELVALDAKTGRIAWVYGANPPPH